jgi:CRP/FNR family cyclic AMP-dependent transcriptional regulator
VVDPASIDLVPSLAELPAAVRADLAEAFDEVSVPKGARIAKEGDYAYELFAILEGIARVEQDGAVVAKLGEGELFGEVGLLLTGRRTAAIFAETPMRLLTLFEQSFRQLSKEHPEFSAVVHESSPSGRPRRRRRAPRSAPRRAQPIRPRPRRNARRR